MNLNARRLAAGPDRARPPFSRGQAASQQFLRELDIRLLASFAEEPPTANFN